MHKLARSRKGYTEYKNSKDRDIPDFKAQVIAFVDGDTKRRIKRYCRAVDASISSVTAQAIEELLEKWGY